MRIENETAYDSRVLNRIAAAVHVWMAKEIGRRLPQWKRLRAQVVYSRGPWCSGYAYLGGSLTRWRLPKPGSRHVSTRYVAWLIWHELLHVYGYGHDRMSPLAMGHHGREPDTLGWIEQRFGTTLPLAAVKVKAKPTLDERRSARRQRIAASVKRWESKRKRAETALRKLNRQLRALDRQLAAGTAGLERAAALPSVTTEGQQQTG